MIGGDYVARNYEAAAEEGRIVQIAFQGGPKAEVNFAPDAQAADPHRLDAAHAPVAEKAGVARAVQDNACG